MPSKRPGIVTTPRKREDIEPRAIETSRRLRLPYIPRNDRSYTRMMEDTGAAAIYVEGSEAPFIHSGKGRLFFHENTAGMRTKKPVVSDKVVKALDVRADYLVLDCTLGLATDALVVASCLGGGRVIGLESNVMIADIVKRGLKDYSFTSSRLESAAARIKVIHSAHTDFLKKSGDGEYDCVYFDPMFEKTIEESSSMQRLRAVADTSPLSPDAVREACRVARHRVVVKCRRGCFGELEFTDVYPSGNRIIYGIVEV
mgnify:CR=1 FL=1